MNTDVVQMLTHLQQQLTLLLIVLKILPLGRYFGLIVDLKDIQSPALTETLSTHNSLTDRCYSQTQLTQL